MYLYQSKHVFVFVKACICICQSMYLYQSKHVFDSREECVLGSQSIISWRHVVSHAMLRQASSYSANARSAFLVVHIVFVFVLYFYV